MPVGTHTHDSPGSGNTAAAVYSPRTIQTNVPSTLPSGYAGTYDAVDLKVWPEKGIVTTNTLEDLRKGTNQLAKDFNDAIVNHQLQLTRNDNDITIIDTNLTEIQDDLRNIAVDLSNKAFDTIIIAAGTGLDGGGNLEADRTINLKIAANAEIGGVKSANANSEGHIFVESNGFMTIRNDAVTLGAKTNGPYVKTIEDSGSSDIVVTDVGAETAIAKLGLTDTLTSAQTDFLGGVSGNTVTLPRIKFSKKGRITAKGTQTFQSANNPTITFESDAGGDIDIINPTITLNQTGAQSVKINHADTSTLDGVQPVGSERVHDTSGIARNIAGQYGANHRQVKILDSISVDDRGHVTSITTRPITYGLDDALGSTTSAGGSAYNDGGQYDLHVPTEKDFQTLRDKVNTIDAGAILIDPNNENATTLIDRPVEISKELNVSDDLIIDGHTLFVDSSVNKVGINLGAGATPTVELDVSGAGKFTGALEIGGGLYINDQILHAGDSGNNTSIRFPANDTFTIETGGQERLRVVGGTNDAVKVGIGTSSPGAALHINKDGNGIDLLTLGGSVGSEGNRKMHIVSPATNSKNDAFKFVTGNSFIFRVDTHDTLTIDPEGNVGIGTTSPGKKLDVNGGVNFSADLDVGGTLDVTGSTSLATTTIAGSLDVDNLKLDGNTISTTNSNGDIILDPAGTGFIQVIGTNAIVIPVGDSSQRQLSQSGAIRYNSETQQFEGYAENAWASLGGVRSVDGKTFISAEDSPGGSNDVISFNAGNVSDQSDTTTSTEVATLDSLSFRILNNTTSSNTTSGSLVVTGGAGFSGDLNVGGDITLAGDINLGGELISSTFTSSGGNFTVDNSGNIGVAGVLSVASKIQHTGDTNTFLEFPSNDVFRIVTNNGERLRVASNGSVGIGTNNPSTKLDVRGNVLVTDGTQFAQLTSTGSLELRKTNGAFIDFSDGALEDRDCRIFQTSNGLGFQTGGEGSVTTKMVIESDGKVGIGIDNPSAKLHVKGASGGGQLLLKLNADTESGNNRGLEITGPTGVDDPVIYNTGNSHEFRTDNTTRLHIKADGAVGIGTSSPISAFQVQGATLVSDDGAGDFVKQNVSGTTSNISLGSTQDSSGGVAKLSYNRSTGNLHHYIGINAGTNYMTITGGGNVGIGTNSASTKLEVAGSTKINGNLNITSGTSGDASLTIQSDTDNNNESDNPIIFLRQDGGTVGVNMGFREAEFGENNFGIGTRYGSSDNNEIFIIDTQNDKIGIGTNAPSEVLTVKDGNILLTHTASSAILNTHTTGGTVTLRHGVTYGLVGTTTNTKFTIRTNNTDKITVLADGKVGIGTSDPGSKLHVNGTAQANNLVSNGKLTIKTNGAHIALNASGSSTELADIEMDNTNGLQISCTTSTAAGKKIRLRPDNTDSFISYATYNDSVVAMRASQLNSRGNSSSLTMSGGASSGNGAHILLKGGSAESSSSHAFHDASAHVFRTQNGGTQVMVIENDKVRLPNTAIGDINENQEVTTKAYVDDKVSTEISNIDVPTFSYNSSNKTLTITT